MQRQVMVAVSASWGKGPRVEFHLALETLGRAVPEGLMAVQDHKVDHLRTYPWTEVVAQCASSGLEICANFPQQEQQTNKGFSWNTHN